MGLEGGLGAALITHCSAPSPPSAAALTVGIGWVVVEDAAGGPVVAAQHDEVALVVGGAAEAAVASGGEAAVLDGAGAQVAVQHSGVHKHDGHVALGQVGLDILNAHSAGLGGERKGSAGARQLPMPISGLGVSPLGPSSLQVEMALSGGLTGHEMSRQHGEEGGQEELGTSWVARVAITQPHTQSKEFFFFFFFFALGGPGHHVLFL